MTKIAFFDTKAYDRPSFEAYGHQNGIEFTFFETKLNESTAELANGFDGVCAFVNDTINAKVIDILADRGVKVLALRCAGYNNVDLAHARGKLQVVRVPAYSPYAVAEHTMALLRKMPACFPFAHRLRRRLLRCRMKRKSCSFRNWDLKNPALTG